MGNKNRTGRVFSFFSLSTIIHCLVVAGIAYAAQTDMFQLGGEKGAAKTHSIEFEVAGDLPVPAPPSLADLKAAKKGSDSSKVAVIKEKSVAKIAKKKVEKKKVVKAKPKAKKKAKIAKVLPEKNVEPEIVKTPIVEPVEVAEEDSPEVTEAAAPVAAAALTKEEVDNDLEDLPPELSQQDISAEERLEEPEENLETAAAATPVDQIQEIEEELTEVAQDGSDKVNAKGQAGVNNAGNSQRTASPVQDGRDLVQIVGNPLPKYPQRARLNRQSGQVTLQYNVTSKGQVVGVRVLKSSGHRELDQSAMNAVSKWRFHPGQQGLTVHPVNFSLKGSAETIPSRLRTSKKCSGGPNTNC